MDMPMTRGTPMATIAFAGRSSFSVYMRLSSLLLLLSFMMSSLVSYYSYDICAFRFILQIFFDEAEGIYQ